MFAIIYLVSLVNTALYFQLWAYSNSIFKDWKKVENYLTVILYEFYEWLYTVINQFQETSIEKAVECVWD